MKICRDCKVEKPLSDFYEDRKRGGGIYRDSYCRPCRRERLRLWRVKNPDAGMEQHLRRAYGITSEQYQQMMEEQGGVCAICQMSPSGNGKLKTLHVDHDADTKEVRGLLCHGCNAGIGLLCHDIARLEKAIQYLRR